MPKFSEPYRNLTHQGPFRKGELLREIAARTFIKESVVAEVLETFRNVAIEEIVNKGEFNFSGLFSVTTYEAKATQTPLGFSPARRRLSARLSDRVKKIWNSRFRAGVTQAESYQELQSRYLDKTVNSLRDSIGLLEPEKTSAYNPMLDDDDEF